MVKTEDVRMDEFLQAPLLIVEEGSVFEGECRVAGHPTGVRGVAATCIYVKRLRGYKRKHIVRLQSGTPGLSLRLMV